MYCDRCGAELQPGAAFCTNCGATVSVAPEERFTYPSADYSADYSANYSVDYPAAPAVSPGSVLTMGILAVAFCCTFYFSFLGIVFGPIGMHKARTYDACGGVPSGMVKAGRIMSIIGLILGIILTVVVVIVGLAFIFTSASYYY